ncbi:MAG: HigA family addiction module antitoxin [Rhodospirillaceae bacterium]
MPTPEKPPHPGYILQRRFMDPNRIGINQLARAIDVPPNRISTIVNGQRSITADTALRLAKFFDTTALYWMNIQNRYDLSVAEAIIAEDLQTGIPRLADGIAHADTD